MSPWKSLYTLLWLTILMSLLAHPAAVRAQEQNGWSAPYQLSVPDSDASEGFMVSDSYGFVHTFWAEKTPEQQAIIQYARFNGTDWSPPLDIYNTPPSPSARIGFISPVIDSEGWLHLAWTLGSSGPVLYSRAPVHDALSAWNWSQPQIVNVPASQVRLQVDSKGGIHIVYTNVFGHDPVGVYYVGSVDQGQIWSSPFWLDPDIPIDHIPPWLQFQIDATDGLHVVWNYLDSNNIGQAIRYSHSMDSGKSWSSPFTIDQPSPQAEDELRMSNPDLVVHQQDVYVVWGGGAGGDTGGSIHREYRYSTDAGQSWSNPFLFFEHLTGQAIGAGMAVDAVGRLHYATQVRYPKAIWHTYWAQNSWSPPTIAYLIANYDKDPMEQERIHAHHVRLALRAGNQLVMTFTDAPGEVEKLTLYAMHRTLEDVEPTIAKPTPEASPTTTPNPSPHAASMAATPAATPTVVPPSSLAVDVASTPVSGPADLLWLALIPAIMLVGGVLGIQLTRKHR